MTPQSVEDHEWSPGTALLRAVAAGAAAGVVMGLAYFALTWCLADWVRTTDFSRRFYGQYHTPFILIPFAVVGGLCAYFSLRIAERVSGFHGFWLMLPVIATAAVATSIAFGLSRMTIDPWSDRFWWMQAFLPFGMIGAVAIRILRSG